MFTIPLTNSELSVEVSEQDYLTLLLLGPWHLAGKGYARTNRSPYEYLHRVVANRMNLDPKLEVDHEDRNKLNAKRENIRTATRAEQCQNTGLTDRNTSGHKNISYDKRPERRYKWVIQVKRGSDYKRVGAYLTLEEAIRQRDAYLKRNNMTLVE